MFWILCCMNMQTWWSKKGWFVLYIKWKQTLLSVLWLGGVSRAGRGGPWGKAWRCLASRHIFHFLECDRRVSCLKRKSCLEIWRSKQIPSECFVGKLRHFFEKRRSQSPSWWSSWGFWSSNDFMACQRAQADLFYHWLRWLKSFTEVKTILIAQNQGASVKPCGVPYELYYSYIIYIYIHITFALIYQWLAFYIVFFVFR